MRTRFRSLLIERAGVRVPGLTILDLALHRHLSEVARTDQHEHSHEQALFYLNGTGLQALGPQEVRVETGSLIMIPRGVPHAFARLGSRPPLCLMINFRVQERAKRVPAVSILKRAELSQIRQSLALLIKLSERSQGRPSCEDAAVILDLLLLALRSVGWLERHSPVKDSPEARVISELLKGMRVDDALRDTVKRSGYARDYLNRLVKRERGLTLGQVRAEERLKLAKDRLSQGLRVSAVAEEVGLPDQSYFARWFRRQTGVSPSRWAQPPGKT